VSKSALTPPRWELSGPNAIYAVLTAVGFIVVGFSFAGLVVGVRVVNPFDTSWLTTDPATSYLGWAFFRNEPRLSFPLGWSSAIGYPLGEPIAYLDSIPMLAMIFWLVRHILPADFQYLGLWFAFNSVLQLYFGYRISRRLVGNNKAAAMAGSLLFMTAPAFIYRAIGHFALSTHWIVLAALEIFMTAAARISRVRAIASVVLCFVAGSINPYLTVMVLLIVLASYLHGLLSTEGRDSAPFRSRMLHAALVCLISTTAAAAALVIFGFLLPGNANDYAGAGYGVFSMNLLAPIDPMNFQALLLRPQPMVGIGQYEGYNYFGLGVIFLGVVALAFRPSAAKKLFTRNAIAAWVIVAVSLFLALSLKATVGTVILYDVSAPQWLLNILSSLRSSGRLFWPAYYLILSGIIAAAFSAFEGRKLLLIMSTAFLIQVADLKGLYAFVHAEWQSASSAAFTDASQWQALGRNHRHLVVVPPWQCSNPEGTPGGARGYWIFGKLAAQQNMTINSFYAGRTTTQQSQLFCNQQISGIERDGLDGNTAYVFSSLSIVLPLKLRNHHCRPLNGVILCSADSGHEGFDLSLLGSIPVTTTGEFIPVNSADTRANILLENGWSKPELWGRWTDGSTAIVILRVADSARDAVIDLSVTPFASSSHHQRVDVLANGSRLANWFFDSRQQNEISIRVPAPSIRSNGIISLMFWMPDAISPSALGLSADTRQLGIGLSAIRITQP
jgi:hypothetical protein